MLLVSRWNRPSFLARIYVARARRPEHKASSTGMSADLDECEEQEAPAHKHIGQRLAAIMRELPFGWLEEAPKQTDEDDVR